MVPGARSLVKKITRKERLARAPRPADPVVARTAAAPAVPSPAAPPDRLTAMLPAFALVVVAVFAIRRLDDFDTWWHLASGRWIVQHHAIPHTDVLSFTVPQNEWINLQWLYDVLLYGMWSLGGASGLVLLSAACFIATFALLARHIARYTGPIATTLLLCWVATTVNERFLIRPEMATFPLLAAVQLVLAEGRERPSRLRWLVPLMVLWANMHSLFILGAGAILCAMAGALAAELPLMPPGWRRDSAWPAAARRELFVWGGVALAATLVNPYFLRALTFPFELISRIDGSNGIYQVIGEFRPPFSGYFLTFALGSYQAFVYTAAALAVVAGAMRAFAGPPSRGDRTPPLPGERAGFDVAVVVFAIALGWLSLLARRNIGVFAVGAVPFVAAAFAIIQSKLPSVSLRSQAASRAATAAAVAGMLAICALVMTNRWYASTGETHEFGLGILESNFQPRATEFFRETRLPGPMYNDMTAGGYLTWDDPTGKGVYVDGRLEVYDTPFFSAYLSNMANIDAWTKDADARGIQSVMLFHRWGNRQSLLRALTSTRHWMLVYYDDTVATLVRADANEDVVAAARTAFSSTWRPRTEATLSGPEMTYSWQWSIARYTGQLAYARLLETIGDRRSALEWFEKAIATGMPVDFEVDARHSAAQLLAASGQLAQARMHLVRANELDPSNESTRAMLTKLDAIAH